jgi:hypothetical protein
VVVAGNGHLPTATVEPAAAGGVPSA